MRLSALVTESVHWAYLRKRNRETRVMNRDRARLRRVDRLVQLGEPGSGAGRSRVLKHQKESRQVAKSNTA